jgi:hypothetical protein
MSELGQWDSFYMIVGSAAAALLGLQFVVMTLVAERPAAQVAAASAAFATPTIVHFSVVLFVSAVTRAPWPAISWIAALWASVAIAGTAYTGIVLRRMRTQTAYRPAFEDWLCHAALPLAAYGALGLSALCAVSHAREALFGIGASVLLLLFLAVHNAWDAVTYHVQTKAGNAKPDDR